MKALQTHAHAQAQAQAQAHAHAHTPVGGISEGCAEVLGILGEEDLARPKVDAAPAEVQFRV